MLIAFGRYSCGFSSHSLRWLALVAICVVLLQEGISPSGSSGCVCTLLGFPVLMGKYGINLGDENPFPGRKVSLGIPWSILVSWCPHGGSGIMDCSLWTCKMCSHTFLRCCWCQGCWSSSHWKSTWPNEKDLKSGENYERRISPLSLNVLSWRDVLYVILSRGEGVTAGLCCRPGSLSLSVMGISWLLSLFCESEICNLL